MAGRDRIITLQRFSETNRNALNEVIGSWGTIARVWSNRRDSANPEAVIAGADSVAVSTRFVVRSNQATRSLTQKDRVWDGSRAWNIKAIAEGPLGRHRTVEIMAVADASSAVI